MISDLQETRVYKPVAADDLERETADGWRLDERIGPFKDKAFSGVEKTHFLLWMPTDSFNRMRKAEEQCATAVAHLNSMVVKVTEHWDQLDAAHRMGGKTAVMDILAGIRGLPQAEEKSYLEAYPKKRGKGY